MLEKYYNFLLEQKGKDLALYDISDEENLSDYVIIQHFNNVQDNKKFADEFMKKFGLATLPEGYNRGEWIIFDLDDVIIHSFVAEKRAKYNLDKLWQSKKIAIAKQKGERRK